MSALFSPYALGALGLANRIVIAPMCQYSCDEGLAGDWHRIHLGQLALSGVEDPDVVAAAQLRARLTVDDWQARRIALLEELERLPADLVLWYAARCAERGFTVVLDDDGEEVA